MNEDTALLQENTKSDYKTKLKKAFIWFWRICIFAITGSSSVHVTSAFLHWFHFSSKCTHKMNRIDGVYKEKCRKYMVLLCGVYLGRDSSLHHYARLYWYYSLSMAIFLHNSL